MDLADFKYQEHNNMSIKYNKNIAYMYNNYFFFDFYIFIGAVDRQFNSDPPAGRHLVFVSPAFLVVFLF